ncbi:nitric oxide reductase transcriptional regulator NorR [Thalassotalea marina]|uniref:Regulatory protein LuxO n=1 Tax=Thalassotalea marina TaxID=1673741 RepID=A0A919BIK2_9GAMM|nr:nitric oxide reductase transcriptional regulator NorR [Thalassotalea marina]GHF91563.1 regulatory protein LuxO [Thalassotalea marina]
MTRVSLTGMSISNTSLIELAINLANATNSNTRFDAMVSAIRTAINCESVALLVHQQGTLVPLALQGLSKDTLGRRFVIKEHPRLLKICGTEKVVKFSKDCTLPDPYDGLLINSNENLPVHACMGMPIISEGILLGVVTFDSLEPDAFDHYDDRSLQLVNSIIGPVFHNMLLMRQLESDISHNQQVVFALSHQQAESGRFEIIGESPAIKKLKQEISLIAPANFNVLIQGESGVGKELVAHQLHLASQRSHNALVYVNCAALPDNLIESELFGHVKGAFTGADKSRSGKFLLADKGTIFLDEIGELPLAVQSKLLRVIQSNEIQVLGSDQTLTVDVRVIAATNRELATEVEQGTFRSDLYHRLHVMQITIPPLRDRVDDVSLLCGYFVEKLKRKLGIPQLTISKAALKYFNQYQWPGNVRELEHSISRAALKASHRAKTQGKLNIVSIEINDCDSLDNATQVKVNQDAPEVEPLLNASLKEQVEHFQKQILLATLEEEQGNISAAAKRLQLDRANLNRLLKRLGVTVKKVVTHLS